MSTTLPLLRVLGQAPAPGSNSDSTITFNGSIVNDSRTGTQDPNKYDLQSTLAHEIDEVLGAGGAGSALAAGQPTNGAIGPLDLYRFSAPGVRSYTTSQSIQNPYFSIDDGNTDLVHFNQSQDGDFADWGPPGAVQDAGNTPPQVQDAFGDPGTEPNLGSNELTSLDVIGWNLTPAGMAVEGIAVPEPTTACMLGLTTLTLLARRRGR